MLVDYADGELSGPDAQGVTEHLAGCPQCRKTLDGLKRSLDLAKAIWLDNLQGSRSAPAAVRHLFIGRWTKRFALAAGILIIIGAVLTLRLLRWSSDQTPSYAQIERQVTHAAAAARLLAATQILAQCEGTESVVEQQYRHILAHYADTPVAAAIRNGKDLRFGEIHND